MSDFAENASAYLSADGLTLTLQDLSNYGSNTEGYTQGNFTRAFILTDAYDSPVATVPITGTDFAVPYSVVKDGWLKIQLALTGINPVPNYTFSFQFSCDRITKNTYRVMLQQGCCANHIIDKRMALADEYLYGASLDELSGNGASFNTNILAASSYLNSPKF